MQEGIAKGRVESLPPAQSEFGQTVADAQRLAKRAAVIRLRINDGTEFGCMFIGISKASFLRQLGNKPPDERLPCELEIRCGDSRRWLWVGNSEAVLALAGAAL
jgi:hypothetical protein